MKNSYGNFSHQQLFRRIYLFKVRIYFVHVIAFILKYIKNTFKICNDIHSLYIAISVNKQKK